MLHRWEPGKSKAEGKVRRAYQKEAKPARRAFHFSQSPMDALSHRRECLPLSKTALPPLMEKSMPRNLGANPKPHGNPGAAQLSLPLTNACCLLNAAAGNLAMA